MLFTSTGTVIISFGGHTLAFVKVCNKLTKIYHYTCYTLGLNIWTHTECFQKEINLTRRSAHTVLMVHRYAVEPGH